MTPADRLLRTDGEALAYRGISGASPTVVWLGGFNSDMEGTKALALEAWARSRGQGFVRFDYYGHGQSSGLFPEGTIGRWRGDALAVVDELTAGPLVLVGSSMGGWIACLVALVRADRIAGLVLIAPALDFTEALLRPSLDAAALKALATAGRWRRPSLYEADGYDISAALLDEGRRWLLLAGPIDIPVPVRIIQGGADPDVPWRHVLVLVDALSSLDVVFTLIKDGDHRLSRRQDLDRIILALESLI
jgi:pimeloyl-ACP methyl ester carboxylesterase